MINKNLEKNIQLTYEQLQVIKYTQLFLYCQINHAETLLIINSLNAAKANLEKRIKWHINSLKLSDYVDKKRKTWFRKRLKRVIIFSGTMIISYFIPGTLKIVWALEKQENFQTVFQKMKKNCHNFIFKQNPEGKEKVNITNILVGSVATISVGTCIYFLLNNENISNFQRLVFKPKLQFPVMVEAALTLEEREIFKTLKTALDTEIVRSNYLLSNMKTGRAFLKLTNQAFDIVDSNKVRTMRTFTRVMFSLIQTGHNLSKYGTIKIENETLFPYLAELIHQKALVAFQEQQKEYYLNLNKILFNHPIFGFAIDYFNKRSEELIKYDNLSFNKTLLEQTTNELVTLFNQQKNKNY